MMFQSRVNTIEMKGDEIHKNATKVGQWIKFVTDEKPEVLSKLQKEMYEKNQVFLVLSRCKDYTSECYFIDNKGKTYKYDPHKGYLGYAFMIPSQKVMVYSNHVIEDTYGMEQILKIYEASQPFFKKMSSFFKLFPCEILDVTAKIQQIKKKMASDPYTHGAVAGALQEKLSFDFSTFNIGPFLIRKEGMILAQTCKAARDGAHEEQARKEAKKMER